MMNKSELIAEIAEKTGESKAAVDRVLATLQDVVIDSVAKGEEIKLTGFAAFTPVTRAPRTAKNPRTGAEVKVPASKTVRIRPLKRFKDTVNGK